MARSYYRSKAPSGIELIPGGVMRVAKMLDHEYFCEEQGLFYEFFTGRCIGCAIDMGFETVILSQDMGVYAKKSDLIPMTEADFAAAVQRYAPHQIKIIMEMERRFLSKRQAQNQAMKPHP